MIVQIRENERRARFLGIPSRAAYLDRVYAVLFSSWGLLARSMRSST